MPLQKNKHLVGYAGVFGSLIFGLTAIYFAYELNKITKEMASIAADSTSFTAVIEGDSLVIGHRGGDFVEPRNLLVEPLFERPGVKGRTVSLPANSGDVDRDAGQISFPNIVSAVCIYNENRELCEKYPVDQIAVYFTVNGVIDVEILSVPQS